MTAIVLADDHTIVRQGLRLLLEAEPDFFIVGEASDGLEVADLVDRLRPDVRFLEQTPEEVLGRRQIYPVTHPDRLHIWWLFPDQDPSALRFDGATDPER